MTKTNKDCEVTVIKIERARKYDEMIDLTTSIAEAIVKNKEEQQRSITTTSSSTPPKRRKYEIEIIDTDKEEDQSDDLMEFESPCSSSSSSSATRRKAPYTNSTTRTRTDEKPTEMIEEVPNHNKRFASPEIDQDYALALKLANEEEKMYGSNNRGAASARSTNTFTCDICLDDDLDTYPLAHNLQQCNHTFCIPCLSSLVKTSFQHKDQILNHIKCPHIKCNKNLTTRDINHILQDDPRALRTYSDLASMAMLENEVATNNHSTRRCPAERCNYTFIYEPGSNPSEGCFFVCPQCDASFCLGCGANDGRVGPAHDGTCYDQREALLREAEKKQKFEEWKRENTEADARFEALIRREQSSGLTKPCPRCKRLVTKNGGCDHMSCICGSHFNWSVEAGFDDGDDDNYDD